MAFLIIFTMGYFLGGVSALIILGLTVAARRGDATSGPHLPAEENIA
ncbi:MAG TPA: hypothetical protein VFU22_09085 [Roseiflexaceae bacterium]|nr:hypothetical protein [Roseiflexaceae bacterium]